MQASNNGPASSGDARFRGGVPAAVDAMLDGSCGYAVRCTPHRRTVMARTDRGEVVFGKLRDGDHGAARREWHWLHVLPMLGIAVPQPVALARRGSRSLVCTAAAPGRPLDALLLECARAGRHAVGTAFVRAAIAPRIARLHDDGLVFRDLYWNHLFATGLAADAEVTFVDVERILRPRLRRRRWWIKDLAGLASSLPAAWPVRDQLRVLRDYLIARGLREPGQLRRFARACARKAVRIRSHVPKYG